jgi:hypothetical protein
MVEGGPLKREHRSWVGLIFHLGLVAVLALSHFALAVLLLLLYCPAIVPSGLHPLFAE